jgi:hypothetical protein
VITELAAAATVATAEVERVAMASEMATQPSRSACWTNETAVAVMRERRVSAAVHLVIAVLAVATTAKAAVSKATVSLGEDSNNDGCSGKDGGRFGGGGNKVDPSSRIGSGGDVGGDGKSNSNSDSQAADSDGVQNFKNGGCCEACDGSGSNGGSGGGGGGSSRKDGVDNDDVDNDGEDRGRQCRPLQ